MPRILCMGELLIDFVSPIKDNLKERVFYQHPGGAPANVAMGLSKYGINTYFLGKVGYDQFGDFLEKTLVEYGVHIDYLYKSSEKTTLAFVNVDKRGERNFCFYRNPGADTRIKKADIEKVDFNNFDVIHFGSLSLTNNPSRSSILKAIKKSSQYNNLISFDPNLRFSLWKNKREIKKVIKKVLPFVDLLKLNKEELFFLTEIQDLHKASQFMLKKGINLIIVSLGKEGVFFNSSKYNSNYIRALEVESSDSTGAGDALTTGVLSKINSLKQLKLLDENKLKEVLEFANSVAGLSTIDKGAVYSLPEEKEAKNWVYK